MRETCPACEHAFEAVDPTALLECPSCSVRFLPQDTTSVTLITRGAGGPVPAGEVPLSPEFLARYRPGWVLGSGATGTVYLAQDRATGLPVAIKFLTRLDDREMLARFVREGRLLTELRHPAIVRVDDVGEQARFPYMVLEYVDGGSLADLLKRRTRLPAAEAVALVTQVLAGLSTCHARGIVHRDLKPAKQRVVKGGSAQDYLRYLGAAQRQVRPSTHNLMDVGFRCAR